MFDALTDAEKQEPSVRLLRRVVEVVSGDVREDALVAAAEDLFLKRDARRPEMLTESVSTTVDADAARAFCQAPPEERRKMEIFLGLRLRELTSEDASSLKEMLWRI